MAKQTKAERQARRASKQAMRANKQQQRRDAKTERQAQRQATRIAAQQQRTDRVQSRQDSRRGRVSDRQAGKTNRTEFRQNPLNVAQRQQTMRGAFEGIAAVGGDVLDFMGSSQQVDAFNQNPEEYAAAFGVGSGVTPAPDLTIEEEIPFFEDEENRPLIIAGAIAAVGGVYYLTRMK